MTDQQRSGGYRGALPARGDALARPWILIVIAIFLLMFVLAFMGFPSSLFSEAAGSPQPSGTLAASASAAPSGAPAQ
jgi:hypothetical protein